jgi:hypothetical protein
MSSRTLPKVGQCSIIILDCMNNDDRIILKELIKLAEEYKTNFIKIFPWKNTCDSDDISKQNIGEKVYIAIDLEVLEELSDHIKIILEKLNTSYDNEILIELLNNYRPLICGWANVNFKSYKKYADLPAEKIAYIYELSTNRNFFKGIGKGIINEIEKEDIDFIDLINLDEDSYSFYTHLGFKIKDDGSNMLRKKKKKSLIGWLFSLTGK